MSDTGQPTGPAVLLTGANGVIGKAIAAQLSVIEGMDLVLACRREGPAKELVVELKRRAPRHRTLTPDGIETQFATHVLGYVWMMEAFAPLLAASGPSRIVNVASYWADDLDLDDLQFERRPYDNNTAYRQSKQAERMLTVAYAKHFEARGISVNACHPGDVSSKLSNDLGFGGSMTADECARTPVWLATQPAGVEQSGSWFASCRRERCSFSHNLGDIARLDAICRTYL